MEIAAVILALVALVLLDGVWLWASSGFYPVTDRNLIPLFVVYEIGAAVGVAYFVSDDWSTNQTIAAVIALWVYGTFNITSLATNTLWTFRIALIDTIVGVCIYEVAFAAAALV